MRNRPYYRPPFVYRWLLLLLFAKALYGSHAQSAKALVRPPAHTTQALLSQPAIPAILRAFKSFEVVGMPAAHGQKDVDDLILSLIRDPRFPMLVNDIVVECGNVRYQELLDRYISGENVSFRDVQPVWRDTTIQQMCGSSGFYEMLFPLVRAINHQLPPSRRLRVVAADPPIDWSQIHSYDDLQPFFDRDGHIANVMRREVLAKHRKALMLFGIFHLIHGGGPGAGDAVTRYERQYPGKTFVIAGDLGFFNNGSGSSLNMSAGGVSPSLLRTKRSKLGTFTLDAFLQSPFFVDDSCIVTEAFENKPDTPVSNQIDAFLYLGPRELQLAEPVPSDIVLDRSYRTEWLRRMKVVGLPAPASLQEIDAAIVAQAAEPVLTLPSREPRREQTKARLRQDCLMRKQIVPKPDGTLK